MLQVVVHHRGVETRRWRAGVSTCRTHTDWWAMQIVLSAKEWWQFSTLWCTWTVQIRLSYLAWLWLCIFSISLCVQYIVQKLKMSLKKRDRKYFSISWRLPDFRAKIQSFVMIIYYTTKCQILAGKLSILGGNSYVVIVQVWICHEINEKCTQKCLIRWFGCQ